MFWNFRIIEIFTRKKVDYRFAAKITFYIRSRFTWQVEAKQCSLLINIRKVITPGPGRASLFISLCVDSLIHTRRSIVKTRSSLVERWNKIKNLKKFIAASKKNVITQYNVKIWIKLFYGLILMLMLLLSLITFRFLVLFRIRKNIYWCHKYVVMKRLWMLEEWVRKIENTTSPNIIALQHLQHWKIYYTPLRT